MQAYLQAPADFGPQRCRYSPHSVAEHAVAMLLCLNRRAAHSQAVLPASVTLTRDDRVSGVAACKLSWTVLGICFFERLS